jgi:hypothetical protein
LVGIEDADPSPRAAAALDGSSEVCPGVEVVPVHEFEARMRLRPHTGVLARLDKHLKGFVGWRCFYLEAVSNGGKHWVMRRQVGKMMLANWKESRVRCLGRSSNWKQCNFSRDWNECGVQGLGGSFDLEAIMASKASKMRNMVRQTHACLVKVILNQWSSR